ncbi:hypothetical protein BY458DRAFT_563364, partial [Sporodiniella umbellata]
TSSPKFRSIFEYPVSSTNLLIYKTGSSGFSVAYTVSVDHRHIQVEFLSKLRQEFSYGVGYAIQRKEKRNQLFIEVTLSSEGYCKLAVKNFCSIEISDFQP